MGLADDIMDELLGKKGNKSNSYEQPIVNQYAKKEEPTPQPIRQPQNNFVSQR